MTDEQGKTASLPKIIKRYDIKKLLEQSPALIPGIEDLIFTVSVNNDIVAINPQRNDQDKGLAMKDNGLRGLRGNTVFLHK